MTKYLRTAMGVVLSLLILAINYKVDLRAALGPGLSKVGFDQLIASLRLCALGLAIPLAVSLLLGPLLQLTKTFSRSAPDSIASDLADAQEYSSEILRRLVRGLPLEVLLFKISGTDKKHIHSYSDKAKQKTAGLIMLVVGIYTLLAIHYLIGDPNADLIDSTIGSSFDADSLESWRSLINSLARQHSLAIGIIFAIFVVSIDRLIISDHALEYRLFKVRLQAWANDAARPMPPSRINDARTSDAHRQSSWLAIWRWKYLSWYWLRAKPLKLPLAAENSTQWSLDAASLFHPRAFISTALILAMRLAFAWYTSVLVTNAFLLKIYEKDVSSQTHALSVTFGAQLSACADASKPTPGCALRASELKLARIESDKIIYGKAALDETQADGKITIFCRYLLTDKKTGSVQIHHYDEVPRDKKTNQEICDERLPYLSISKIPHSTIISLQPEATSGQKSKNKPGIRQLEFQELAKQANALLDQARKDHEKNQDEIASAIKKFSQGISVRLEALDRIREGADIEFPTSDGAQKSNAGGAPKTKPAHIELAQSLRVLLMAFETIPILMLKVLPLFGWMPSLYTWSYCVHRIKAEQAIGAQVTSQAWPLSTLPHALDEWRAASSERKSEPEPEDGPKSRFAGHDAAALVVGLLNSLRLPIVVVSAAVMGLFLIVKPVLKFLNLAPNSL